MVRLQYPTINCAQKQLFYRGSNVSYFILLSGVFGGGTASASCELICPTTPTRRVIPPTIDSIDCTWSPGRRLSTCPDTFDRDFTEIYYCDNGQEVCCTFSRTIGRVHLDGLGSTCSRGFNKAEDVEGQGGLLASDEEQGYLLQVVSEVQSPEEAGDGGVRVNGGEECSPETIIELTCNNGGGSKGEMVSMTCDEAKAAAPGMLKDFWYVYQSIRFFLVFCLEAAS